MILSANSAYSVVSDFNISFAEAGITASNTRAIYKVFGALYSYVPGRPINQITGFEVGVGYYIITGSATLDLTGIIRNGTKINITQSLNPPSLNPTDPTDTPTGNTSYIAMQSGTYNNLKLASGASAPSIVVSPTEALNPFVFLVYNAASNTWSKDVKAIDPALTLLKYRPEGEAGEIVATVNMFNKDTVRGGYLTGSSINPDPSYDPAWKTSDFIPVVGKGLYTVKKPRSIVEISETGTILNYIDLPAQPASYTFECTPGAKIVTYTTLASDVPLGIFNVGPTLMEYEPYNQGYASTTKKDGRPFFTEKVNVRGLAAIETTANSTASTINNLVSPYPMVGGLVYWISEFGGFGTFIKGSAEAITNISVRKLGVLVASQPITVSLWSSTTGTNSNKTLIQAFTLPAATYNAATDGDKFTFNLTTPFVSGIGGFFAVTVEVSEFVRFQQINKNNYPEFVTGIIYKPTYAGSWTVPNEEGLYFEVGFSETKIPVSRVSGLDAIVEDSSRSVDMSTLEYQISLINQRTVNSEVGNIIMSGDKDEYVEVEGDSIAGWQSSPVAPPEGVTNVPPVCDRTAFAYWAWKTLKYGNAVYMRFDAGKHSLVGPWDPTLSNDTGAKFIETGTFGTRYDAGSGAESADVGRTTTSSGDFATPFDDGGRSIPHRFANAANASIQLVIPAGNKKFDFIFHAHTLGDVLTVSTNRANGIVQANAKHNDWANAVEANAFTFNTVNPTYPQGDTRGIACKRMHFNILDTSVPTTVTITKSSNTAKYLIYWGACYWGSDKQQYALHLCVNARGGFDLNGLAARRDSDIKDFDPSCVVFEIPCINIIDVAGNSEAARTQVRTQLTLFMNYLNGLNIKSVWILPHIKTPALITQEAATEEFYKFVEGYIKGLGGIVAGSAYKMMRRVWTIYYKTKYPTYTNFINTLMYDSGVHPKDTGFLFYKIIFENLMR